MSAHDPQRLQAGDRVPLLELPTASTGEPRSLRTASRDALVLLLLPAAHEAWSGYVEGLARAAAEIEQWYARILVVATGEPERSARLHEPLTVLSDTGGEAARRLGIDPAHAALVIADRYGQIYELTEARQVEDLPSPAEVEEWVKYLATQCPECGVIDEPGYGEWALA